MIIIKHGDIMLFECKLCGCRFTESVAKSGLAHCGVWNQERQETGTRMKCPDCGEDVLGFRLKPIKNEKDNEDKKSDG